MFGKDEEAETMSKITADWTELLKQAPHTVGLYLVEAAEAIDKQFGVGYASKHPELVAAFIKCCTTDFCTSTIAKTIQDWER